jgi:hypothetical protein
MALKHQRRSIHASPTGDEKKQTKRRVYEDDITDFARQLADSGIGWGFIERVTGLTIGKLQYRVRNKLDTSPLDYRRGTSQSAIDKVYDLAPNSMKQDVLRRIPKRKTRR